MTTGTLRATLAAVAPGPEAIAAARPAIHVHEVLDPEGWDEHVTGLAGAEIEQGWAWGECAREAGWTPRRLAVSRDGVPAGVVAALVRPLPGLPASVAYAPRAPLAGPEAPHAYGSLVEALRWLGESVSAVAVRLSPGVPADRADVARALRAHGLTALGDDWTTWNAPRLVMRVVLDGGEEAAHRRLRKQIRQDVASAVRQGVAVRAATSAAGLAVLHRLLVATGRRKGYPVRRLARFEALWRAYVARGQGVLLVAEAEGTALGGLLATRFGRVAYLQAAAVDRDAGRLRAGALLYWSLLRWASAEGCAEVDLGGSGTSPAPSPADPGWGLYQFKRGFGARLEYRLAYHDLVLRPALYRALRLAETRLLPLAWRLRARLNG
jgi:peptidoglycan pentaglycine glycine transferase (the first glycine)